jgi:hypothetical protein
MFPAFRRTPRRALISFLVVSCLALVGGVAGAGAVVQEPDHSTGAPVSDDLYKILNRGQPFQCDPKDCHIKATISITSAQMRYLGLHSKTLAQGSPDGPVTAVLGERRQHNLYFLKLPASVGRAIKRHHVVSMSVKIKGGATWTGPALDGGDGADVTARSAATQTFTSTWPDPDDLSRMQWGQGSRYGCAPKAGGTIIIGYLHFGQQCPK